MVSDYKFLDQSDREWRTWWQVCKQLRARGIEPNDPQSKPLIDSIKLWAAEERLLLAENDDPKAEAHEDALRRRLREAYAPHVIGEWGDPGEALK